MSNFAELGVLPAFAEKLAEKNISGPTAVQRMAIPPLLEGKSIVFRSATGTGKTFAYLIPALQRILAELPYVDGIAHARSPALVICAPTIELCSQIKNEADFLLENMAVRKEPVSLLIGSMNLNKQIISLKKDKPLAVVGNPGRLLLLAKKGSLKFRALRYLVFDEADRLTAGDSREDTAALVQIIAGQTKAADAVPLVASACSATVTAKTRECLLPLLAGSELLETDEQEILRERIEHWAIFSDGRLRTKTLISFLAAAKQKKILVFASRSHDVGKISAILQKRHISAAGLYAGMEKNERKAAIDQFRSGKTAVLVSSDLAARGLDIPGITHVAALDVSKDKDAYIHRCGRTGRAGKRGIMVSIGDEIDMHRLANLEKKLGITVYPKELHQGRVCTPASL
ncbi:MAG: DEAD/DEAH box helicase, partial [Treponema sp.]|nr:DEAD/DEAH box helicase [Treponema sp.]